jgi:hypothetical protein
MTTMRPRSTVAALAALAFALPSAVACSSSSSSSSSGGSEPTPADVDASVGKRTDASDAAPSVDPAACEGPCKVTTGVASFGGKEVSFDRAQFGLDGDAGSLLRVEAHVGGDPACPTQASPTPDQTLIVAGMPRGAPGKALTKADGVTATLIDFKGGLLSSAKPESATDLLLTVRAQDPAASPQWVGFEIQATFPTGAVKAYFYAARCASLD